MTDTQENASTSRVVKWLKKYFCEGQSLSKRHEEETKKMGDNAPWYRIVMVKYRRLVAMVLPALFFHFWWWSVFINYNLWHLFKEKYFMSFVMIFGSLIAGMTSEGGGAVAYPTMTLAFNIRPSVARDFSLVIQSCGMSAASFAILFMRVKIEWFAIIFCSLGGVVGMIFGLHVIDPALTAAYKKMGFVCIWFTFAFALYLLNRYRKRTTYRRIPDIKLWKVLVLTVTGLVGGIFTSCAGSGLDICSFSILTLLFRVSEKTATPTSVILMAGNSVVAICWRQFIMQEVSTETWEFLGVCLPIVVIGAPSGSVLGSHFHRLVLASLIYLIDTVALVSAFFLVPLTPWLIGYSVIIIVVGFVSFFVLTKIGERLMINVEWNDQKEQEECDTGPDHDTDVVVNKNVDAELAVPPGSNPISNSEIVTVTETERQVTKF